MFSSSLSLLLRPLSDQIRQGDTVYVYLDQQGNTSSHGLGAGLTAGRPIPPPRRGSQSEAPGGWGKTHSGGVEQIIRQDFMHSSEWDTKNRIMFPVHLIRACDFKAITGFDPPPTPVNAATYAEHTFEFPEEYIERGMIKTLILDGKGEEEVEENRVRQGEENVYELPAFEEDFLDNEFDPRQTKCLSIRNFV